MEREREGGREGEGESEGESSIRNNILEGFVSEDTLVCVDDVTVIDVLIGDCNAAAGNNGRLPIGRGILGEREHLTTFV